MNAALFDVLLSDTTGSVVISIREHLMRLFNARRGALCHLPHYGLPDISDVYQGLPYSLQGLKLAIVQLIQQYEPRLCHVKVDHTALLDQHSVLRLEISGQLKNNQNVLFETSFLSGGKAIISKI